MSVQLSISTEEAHALLMCLGYVRSNIVLDSSKMRYKFVSGKPLNLSIREGVGIDFLKDYIETETERAINAHPFNPYISTL